MKARFTAADVARAVSGAIKGGMRVGRVEIEPDGRIVLLPEGQRAPSIGNSCDDLLPPKTSTDWPVGMKWREVKPRKK